MTQPNGTTPVFITTDNIDNAAGTTALLLTSAAQQAVLPRKLEEGVYGVLNPEGGVDITETPGYTQHREEAWLRARSDRPEFVHRSPVLLDVDSFVDYLARNTTGSTAEVDDPEYAHAAGALELWADLDGRKITAILDGYDGLRQHTATLALKVFREWAEWSHIDGKLFPQVQFAQFIEDHISSIGEPSGGILLDVVQTLTAKTKVDFRSSTMLANGQRQFEFAETIEAKAGAKGTLAIPAELKLVLRPFQGSDPVVVTARFRYQISEGALALGVRLAEPQRVLEEAFDQIVAEVGETLPVRVNHGVG